ncbi:MAG: rhombosortase [Pseudomonadales bacterium]|nr:rhombosortase [Pseudomonadales bacterium]
MLVALLLAVGMPGQDVPWAELRPSDGSAWREPWRLLLGHFVHHSWPHLLMNTAALGLWFALWRETPASRLAALLFVALGTGAAVALVSERSFVVGLSGLLHGLFAASAVAAWRAPTERIFSGLVLLAIVAKLVAEQLLGPSAGTAALIGLPVATEAHVCGAVVGVGYGLWRLVTDRRPVRASERA